MSVSRAQDLVYRFTLQILNGCSDSSCTNEACYSGRRNLSGTAPCRRYTPRSARAIAYVLANEPHPESRLCENPARHETRAEGTRDPSDLMQLWSETDVVKEFAARSPDARPSSTRLNSKLEDWHPALNDLMRPPGGMETMVFPEEPQRISIFSWTICECLVHLLYLVPPAPPIVTPTTARVVTPRSKELWMDAIRYHPAQRVLRHLLTVLAARTSVEIDMGWKSPTLGELGNTLVNVVAGLEDDLLHYRSLAAYLQVAFLSDWQGNAVVNRLSVAAGALQLFEAISQACDSLPDGDEFSFHPTSKLSLFPELTEKISPLEIATTWCNWSWNGHDWHLLLFGCLFPPTFRLASFRCISHIRMREVHSAAEMASALRRRLSYHSQEVTGDKIRHDEQHYLMLNVSRSSVLKDAYDQLWHRRRGELLLPLRVRLGQMDELEIGHDLGGVQIEFFNLICQEVFGESSNTFATDPQSGYSYFQPMSLEPLWRFEMLGLLFGLAVHNAITLPVNLPIVFYEGFLSERRAASFPFDVEQKQADYRLDLMRILDAWPVLYTSLKSVATEDIEVDYAFPLEANGLRMMVRPNRESTDKSRRSLMVYSASPLEGGKALELVDIESIATSWHGWHLERCFEEPEVVSSENREAYVRDYVQWLTHDSVAPQREAFEKGFEYVVPKKHLAVFHRCQTGSIASLSGANDLKSYVEGTSRLDLSALRQATVYNGYDPNSGYMRTFWRVVQQWPEDKQKALVKFVTAVERLPLNMASFRFVIKRATSVPLDHLPTSSTCFGTLQLPQYGSEADLDEKLSRAIEYGLVGFGTA